MSTANMLSALLAPIIVSLLACYAMGGRRRFDAPDEEAARRRAWVAWEVRFLAIAVAGPLAAGIFFGYLATDYTLPLCLFVLADFLAAGLIAPTGVHLHD